jgi:hypothetical protein
MSPICAAVPTVVLPAWTDLSDVLVPPGFDVAVAADGELFGLPVELQEPLLGLVGRWFDRGGLSDEEVVLRGWDEFSWPDWRDDDFTVYEQQLDAQLADEALPTLPGDEATIGWTIINTSVQGSRVQSLVDTEGHARTGESAWPDRRGALRLVASLNDLVMNWPKRATIWPWSRSWTSFSAHSPHCTTSPTTCGTWSPS